MVDLGFEYRVPQLFLLFHTAFPDGERGIWTLERYKRAQMSSLFSTEVVLGMMRTTYFFIGLVWTQETFAKEEGETFLQRYVSPYGLV